MAVPGSVLSGRNRGSHGLLKDGAKVVESAVDILEGLGWPVVAPSHSLSSKELNSDNLLSRMEVGEVYRLDELMELTGVTGTKLLPRLMELELAGLVTSGQRVFPASVNEGSRRPSRFRASAREAAVAHCASAGQVLKEMAKSLVVVESPAKAKTINKYLGRNYKVLASMGHVRDLPKKARGRRSRTGSNRPTKSSPAEEGARRAQGGGEGRDGNLPRDRPRPRRRGDRLASGRRAGLRERKRSAA